MKVVLIYSVTAVVCWVGMSMLLMGIFHVPFYVAAFGGASVTAIGAGVGLAVASSRN